MARPPRARLGLRAGGARLSDSSLRVRMASLTPARLRPALFWRVAAGNAAVLAAACVITALAFRRDASDVALRELAIFVVGLALMLGLNLLLLRRAFAPLRQLTAFARTIDPLDPGPRLTRQRRRVRGRRAGGRVQRHARPPGGRAARQRRPRAGRPGGRAAARRPGAARRRRADADGRRACSSAAWPRTSPSSAQAGVLEAQETARGSLEEVRRIARRLRPEALDDLGLASALHVLGERVGEHSGLELDVHVQPGLPELAPEAELVVYRVAQEALTNVARHADATHAARAAGDGRRRIRASRSRTTAPGRRRTAARAAASAACASAPCSSAPHCASARAPGAAHASPWSCPRHDRRSYTRILLADDHAVVRRGLRLVLEGEPDLRVVAEAGDGAEAVEHGPRTPRSTSPSSTSRCRA